VSVKDVAVGKVAAAKRAQEVLVECGVTSAPVPVERIAKALGAAVRYAPLDDALSGMAYVKDGVPVIGVNSLHHPNRQRFTIAHEIAHLVLHREYITAAVHVDTTFVLNRDEKAATGTDAIEIDANAFAAELLMPADLLREAVYRESDLEDEDTVAGIARKFKVSTAALQNRLLNMAM
jgi:Zn-dependent peptidase ImmA (M78 family)